MRWQTRQMPPSVPPQPRKPQPDGNPACAWIEEPGALSSCRISRDSIDVASPRYSSGTRTDRPSRSPTFGLEIPPTGFQPVMLVPQSFSNQRPEQYFTNYLTSPTGAQDGGSAVLRTSHAHPARTLLGPSAVGARHAHRAGHTGPVIGAVPVRVLVSDRYCWW
jgi:hypothetical protein